MALDGNQAHFCSHGGFPPAIGEPRFDLDSVDVFGTEPRNPPKKKPQVGCSVRGRSLILCCELGSLKGPVSFDSIEPDSVRGDVCRNIGSPDETSIWACLFEDTHVVAVFMEINRTSAFFGGTPNKKTPITHLFSQKNGSVQADARQTAANVSPRPADFSWCAASFCGCCGAGAGRATTYGRPVRTGEMLG